MFNTLTGLPPRASEVESFERSSLERSCHMPASMGPYISMPDSALSGNVTKMKKQDRRKSLRSAKLLPLVTMSCLAAGASKGPLASRGRAPSDQTPAHAGVVGEERMGMLCLEGLPCEMFAEYSRAGAVQGLENKNRQQGQERFPVWRRGPEKFLQGLKYSVAHGSPPCNLKATSFS